MYLLLVGIMRLIRLYMIYIMYVNFQMDLYMINVPSLIYYLYLLISSFDK